MARRRQALPAVVRSDCLTQPLQRPPPRLTLCAAPLARVRSDPASCARANTMAVGAATRPLASTPRNCTPRLRLVAAAPSPAAVVFHPGASPVARFTSLRAHGGGRRPRGALEVRASETAAAAAPLQPAAPPAELPPAEQLMLAKAAALRAFAEHLPRLLRAAAVVLGLVAFGVAFTHSGLRVALAEAMTTADVLVTACLVGLGLALVRFMDSVDERFNTVDQRFNTVEQRFNTVDTALTELKALLLRPPGAR